jgi:hypothetical protein
MLVRLMEQIVSYSEKDETCIDFIEEHKNGCACSRLGPKMANLHSNGNESTSISATISFDPGPRSGWSSPAR